MKRNLQSNRGIRYAKHKYMKTIGRGKLSGFTLVELLVVITIIGILITLVTVAVVPIQRKSRDAKRKADINSFLSGVNLFKADFKIYPNSTFYLGSYGGSDAEFAAIGVKNPNSNYAVATDIFNNCNNASVGATSSFLYLNGQTIVTTGKPTVNEMDTKPLLMNPGFVSVNNFLICLRYTDRLVADPKPLSANNWDKYQYRVSYDYGDAVVTSRLENDTDTDSTVLFTDAKANTNKRYYKGSGVVVRHLDDSSDVDGDLNGFFTSLTGGINDGKYLYQCMKTSPSGTPPSTAIPIDNRVSYEPITSGASYGANSTCNNVALDLNVIQAY